MIICIGYPGSGKTSYIKKYLVPRGYKIINQDKLKTERKCKEKCIKALENGKSVVIDRLNYDKNS